MHKYKFHGKWVLPLLVLLYLNTNLIAQCPDTKSATYAMLPQGIPFYTPLQPSDFQVHPADSTIFSSLTLSQGHFTCGDVGIQEVFLTGLTASNESFSCGVNVWVYDSVQLCGTDIFTPRAVGGRILTEKNEGVSDIAIGLSSGTANYFRGSDENGGFLFTDFDLENYRLTPDNRFTGNVRNGVSTLDVLNLQKYILGLKSFDSPYKVIAADVNSSGEITAYDMLLLRQLILSVIDEFPNTPSWKFVDAAYDFEEEINPLKQEIPYSIPLDMTKLGPQLDNRFIAIKIGDLNNSVVLKAGARARANRENLSPVFTLQNEKLNKGETLSIPFALAGDITLEGLQFALEYDETKLSLIGITSDFAIEEENYLVEDGLIIFSWTSEEQLVLGEGNAPLSITFSAKETIELAEAITLPNQFLASEIYTDDSTIIPFGINWENSIATKTFQAFENYPNPFNSTTTIPFYLPQSSTIILQVFDAKGSVVYRGEQAYDAGYQSYQIDQKFSNNGLYFYRLESKEGTTSGRMNYVGH